MNPAEKIRNYELRIYTKFIAITDKLLVHLRKKKLNNIDFSIICNNCWGGYVYRRYGLPYLSPTVGLYFFADDFVKLCSDVKGYMERPLEFISYTESAHRAELEKKKQTNVPLGRLGDIEVVFLHYASEESAAEKWNRRAERINYDNLIFKFSKMNGCTDAHLKAFDQLNFQKKICFVPSTGETAISCGIRYMSAVNSEEIKNDTSEYTRYIDLEKMINSEKVCGANMEGTWLME